jgi:serpin B
MALANSLWLQDGIGLNEEYRNYITRRFESEVAEVDLQAPETVVRINEWVNRATHRTIPKILDEINPEAIMIAISAIWFRGRWAEPFEREGTYERRFHPTHGASVIRKFMWRRGSFSYAENGTFQAVRLMYAGKRFEMDVFLPKKGLANLIEQLDHSNWLDWLHSLSWRPGVVELPRFQVRYSTNLKDALKALGIGSMFEAGRADFSGMGHQGVWTHEVIHRSFVDVDEEGTEAAAVTASKTVFGGEDSPVKARPFHMVVDRPFCFVIWDNFSGTILFMGAVTEIE